MLLSLCARLGGFRRWRWPILVFAGAVTASAAAGCGGSDPDPELLVLPPSSAEALAPSDGPSSAVAAPEPVEPTQSAPPSTASAPTTAVLSTDPAPTAAELVSSTSAVADPVVLAPELDPVPTTESEPAPVSLAAAGAVPEPAEAVVTAAPDDHGHEHPELTTAPVSSLPEPVGAPILLAENTEETFSDGGWVEDRYQPIEIEIGTQFQAPDWEAVSIVTRPPVDLAHNGLWDVYRCSVHEAYGAENGWEFVTYAYRDDDGRFRLVVGSARPVGPC